MSWPVLDPIQWSLEHANGPVLARASEGLGKLTVNDGERILRLVLRRCSLSLIEIHSGQVVVDHWGPNQADLRPFFKAHGLAQPEIEVVLRDRKNDTISKTTGDSFLFGVLLTSDFPLDLFQKKWERRFLNESDDWQGAPNTNSGFAWEGVEEGCIPWIALKSAWRRSGSGVCLNCDGETILTNFGLRQVGFFNRSPVFVSICGECHRRFRDDSISNVRAWILANLDEAVRPDFELMWGKRVKREGQS